MVELLKNLNGPVAAHFVTTCCFIDEFSYTSGRVYRTIGFLLDQFSLDQFSYDDFAYDDFSWDEYSEHQLYSIYYRPVTDQLSS